MTYEDKPLCMSKAGGASPRISQSRQLLQHSWIETVSMTFMSENTPWHETQKTFRYLLRFYSLLFRGFFVALFCLEKQCSGLFLYFFVVFSWLFRGFFVAPVLGKFYAYSPWNSLLRNQCINNLPGIFSCIRAGANRHAFAPN